MVDDVRHRGRRCGTALLILAALGLVGAAFNPLGRAVAQSALLSAASTVDEADTLELTGLQGRFEAIAARVSAGVVAISASMSHDDSDEMSRVDQLTGPKLEAALDRITRTVGTGFVIDSEGYIATNEHVVGDAEQIWVTTDDRKVYPAIVVGSDPRSDLAVLKIPATRLAVVKYAAPECVRRGQWAITLGNPYGLAAAGDLAMSVGVISAVDRSLPKLSSKENRLYNHLLQTTAQINPGNSGGPLFNLDGEVIGINTAVILPQKQTNGIGFAMPVTESLRRNLGRLKDGQEIIHAYLGVTVSSPTEAQRRQAGITGIRGVWVESLDPGGPAGEVLRCGDIVVNFGGREITEANQFINLAGDSGINSPVEVVLIRGTQTIKSSVTAIRRPMPSMAINRTNQKMYWRGMVLGPRPSAAGGAVEGVVVLSADKSRGKVKGSDKGSILAKVAGRPVRSLIELQTIINETPAEKCSLDFASASAIVSAE